MTSKKILIIIGTRPDAIKMAPVIKEIERRKMHKPIIVASAQHRELLDQALKVFSLKPDYDLSIMKNRQDLYYISTRLLKELKAVYNEVQPSFVLVQGDTSTTFIGALAAFYAKVPIAHIEAGLRSFNKYSPFPEEMNRKWTDAVSDFCFAPTKLAKDNLIREGVNPKKIWITGNTAVDALFMVLKKRYEFRDRKLQEILSSKKKLILVTAHRRESFMCQLPGQSMLNGIESICHALIDISRKFKDIEIIYSVHPNPNVRNSVRTLLKNVARIHLIDPPDYCCFCNLMKSAYLILTDSGGIQEEAPSLGKPVLVMRDVTERVEGIENGTAILVGTDREKIVKVTTSLLTDKNKYKKMVSALNPYGDGKASKKIVDILTKSTEPTG